MDKRVWFSRRAVRLHVVILVVVPGFMALCLWQVSRALGGNELSWAYVFEWPIFAAYAIYMWWRFVHEAPEDGHDAPPPDLSGGPTEVTRASTAEPHTHEDSELAAYNEYLAKLAAQDKVHDDGRHLHPTKTPKKIS